MFKIKTIVVAIFVLISQQLYAAQSVEEIIKGRKAMFSENYQNAKKISILLKSKKIEESIDGFLKSIYSKNIIYIIGGPATSTDQKYLSQLKQKYKSFNNVVFKGVVPHNNLKEYLENVNFHINQTSEGNYDKSVLETTVSGILNFYRNSDYDKLFPQEYVNFFKFNNGPVGLAEVISSIEKLNEKDFSKIIKYSQDEIKKESLETLDERIKSIL